MVDRFVGWLRDEVARRDGSDPLRALVAAYDESELLDRELASEEALANKLATRIASVRNARQLAAMIVRYGEDVARFGGGDAPCEPLLAAIDANARSGAPIEPHVRDDLERWIDDTCADDRKLDRSASAFWLAELAATYAGAADLRVACNTLLVGLRSLIADVVRDCFALDVKHEAPLIGLVYRINLSRLAGDCDDIDAGRWA